MCGRVIQSSTPLRLAIVDGLDVSERSLDLIKWGLIPHWCTDLRGDRRPINAKAKSVARLPMFRDAYAQRRCIVPVDGFFECRAIKGASAKQPYAIGMKETKAHVSTLIEMLRDPEPVVVRGAHAALKALSGQDFGPATGADDAEIKKAVAAWQSWWEKQKKE